MNQCKTNAIQKSIAIVTNNHTIIHITTKKIRKTMGKKSFPIEKNCQYTNNCISNDVLVIRSAQSTSRNESTGESAQTSSMKLHYHGMMRNKETRVPK